MKAIKTAVCLACVLGMELTSEATLYPLVQVYDVDFSSETYGSEPTVNGSAPYPATVLGAVGYDSAIHGFTAEQNHTIGDAAGLTKALIMSNTVDGAAGVLGTVNWLDTGWSPTGGTGLTPIMGRLEFDFAVMSRPFGDNGGYRSDWAIVAHKSGEGPAWVFAASHVDTGDNIIHMENTFPNNVNVGVYTQGVSTHVQIDSTFEGGGRYNVYLNGNLALENQAFRSPMVTLPIVEFYIQQLSATNGIAPNVVALDNFKYTLFIPEPSTLVLASMASVVGLLLRFRRR